jgi:hypothetical protein
LFKFEKKQFWVIGLFFALISYIVVLGGVKLILGSQITLKNMVAYGLFSLFVGAVIAALIFFRLKIALWFFLIGLVLGFIKMYTSFFSGLSGWADLIGIMYLFMLVILGLITGVLVQFSYYLFKAFRR